MTTTFTIPEHLIDAISNDKDTEDYLELVVSECSMLITQCQKMKVAYQKPKNILKAEKSNLKVRVAHLLASLALLTEVEKIHNGDIGEVLNNTWIQHYK